MVQQPVLGALSGAVQDAAGISVQQRAAGATGLWRLLGALGLSIALLVGLLFMTGEDANAQRPAPEPTTQTNG